MKHRLENFDGETNIYHRVIIWFKRLYYFIDNSYNLIIKIVYVWVRSPASLTWWCLQQKQWWLQSAATNSSSIAERWQHRCILQTKFIICFILVDLIWVLDLYYNSHCSVPCNFFQIINNTVVINLKLYHTTLISQLIHFQSLVHSYNSYK